MLEFIFQAFLLATISWVYHCVLREKLLSNWFLFGFKKLSNKTGWRYYIYEPVFNCEKCLAGQLALWSFFFLQDYNLFYHIGFISLTIFFVPLIVYATTQHD